jgi:hypothetical protein
LWVIALMIFRSPIGSQLVSMVSQFASSSILAFMARLHWPWMIVKVLLRLSLRALCLLYQSLIWRPYFSSSCLLGCGSSDSVPLFCGVGSACVCFFKSVMHALRSCASLKDEHTHYFDQFFSRFLLLVNRLLFRVVGVVRSFHLFVGSFERVLDPSNVLDGL